MERILLVDDEPMILKALVRLLNRTPCISDRRLFKLDIITISNPLEAIEFVKENPISLIMTDYRMPSIDGVSLLMECMKYQPDAVRLIISGYADLNALINAINKAHIFQFISKPWNDYELVSTIGMALRNRQLTIENRQLAEQAQIAKGLLTDRDLALKRLEREMPGITSVKWAADGSIILDDREELEE